LELEKVVRDSGIETEGTVYEYSKTIQIFAHAGDIALVGRTTGVLKEAIVNLSKAAKEMGGAINLQKNKTHRNNKNAN
jgi:hypothetical protein